MRTFQIICMTKLKDSKSQTTMSRSAESQGISSCSHTSPCCQLQRFCDSANSMFIPIIHLFLLASTISSYQPTTLRISQRLCKTNVVSNRRPILVRSNKHCWMGDTITFPLFSSKPKNVMDDFMSPFRGPDIPPEYVDEIMKAEGSTPAAQDRQGRIVAYALICAITFSLGAFNAFLGISSQGSSSSSPSPILENLTQWNNPILNFFLLNKIGGALSLISTGIGGTMIELEHRTKVENAEKIWNELQRRRSGGGETQRSLDETFSKQKSFSNPSSSNNKKKKQNKRLAAFSELLVETKQTESPSTSIVDKVDSDTINSMETVTKTGLLGKMKDFYTQADQLAASQALLLNKELEDRGILEKITDESGLKVIKNQNSKDESQSR